MEEKREAERDKETGRDLPAPVKEWQKERAGMGRDCLLKRPFVCTDYKVT